MIKRRISFVITLIVMALTVSVFALLGLPEGKVSADSQKPVFDDDGLDYGHEGSYVEFENIPDGTYGYKIYTAWVSKGGGHSTKGVFIYKLSAEQLRNYRFCHVNGTAYYQDFFIVLPGNFKMSKPASSQTLTKVIETDRHVYTFKDDMGYWEYPEDTLYTDDDCYFVYEYDSSGNPVLVEDKAISFNTSYVIWLGNDSSDVISVSIRNIDEFTVGLEESSKSFDGQPIAPVVTGLDHLKEGVDYTVEFDHSACVAGEYKVVVSPVEGRLLGDPVELTYTVNEASGNCGFQNPQDVTWSFDSRSGVMTIRGKGDMDVYDTGAKPAPWSEFRDCIKSVIVAAGVESVGTYAFSNCTKLNSVSLPVTLKTIEGSAFAGCTSLVDITLPDGLEYLYDYAFRDCESLRTINIPESVIKISRYVFHGCNSIADVYCFAGPEVWYDCSYSESFMPDKGTTCHLSKPNWDKYHDGTFSLDLNLTYKADISAARIYGFQMSLDDGIIGVDTYFKNTDQLSFDIWKYMKFTYADGTVEKVSKIEYNSHQSTGYCTITMSAKNINDPIKVQLYGENDKALSTVYTFTPAEYVDYIYRNPDTFEDGKFTELIVSLLSFGASSQKYFGQNKYPMYYDYIVTEYSDEEIAAAAADLGGKYSDYDMSGLDNVYYGSGLILKSGTSLNLYFTKDSNITAASSSSGNASIEETGDYIVVVLSDIKWQDLGKTFSVVLTVDGTDVTVKVSPMTYVYKVLSGDYKDNLKNLVMSLYNLNKRSTEN